MNAIATHEDEKISQICHIVYSTLFGEPAHHQKGISELEETLSTYPPHLIARLHWELTKVQDDLANELVLILSSPVNDSFAVDEYIAFHPYVTKNKKLDLVRKMIHALHSYPQLPAMDNYAEAPESVKSEISALLHVVDLLMHACLVSPRYNYPLVLDNGKVMLDGDDLISLIVTYPDKADLIATTIISRDTKDVTLLHDVITSDAPSISEGKL